MNPVATPVTTHSPGRDVISWPPLAGTDREGRCTGAAWQGRYRERLLLRDGRSLRLRPAHHRDAPLLQGFFAELSPRSRLLRFHGAIRHLPDAAARQLSTQVASRHVALVALDDGPDGEPVICAEARYAIEPEHADEAEFGIAVADDWQQLGLGRALLTRLAIHARAQGIRRLRGSVMAGNEPMLALMRTLGAELRADAAAEVQGVIRL
jgi:RimJ/RimL family protein N-acetyltransferase